MIVDASVVFKWLVDEALSDRAARLLDRRDLFAPTLVDVEVVQALTRRVRQRLLDRSSAEVAVAGLRDAPLERIDWAGVADEALGLCLDLRATYVDCLYLALAIGLDDVMVTADDRFARAVRSEPTLSQRVLSLSDI